MTELEKATLQKAEVRPRDTRGFGFVRVLANHGFRFFADIQSCSIISTVIYWQFQHVWKTFHPLPSVNGAEMT